MLFHSFLCLFYLLGSHVLPSFLFHTYSFLLLEFGYSSRNVFFVEVDCETTIVGFHSACFKSVYSLEFSTGLGTVLFAHVLRLICECFHSSYFQLVRLSVCVNVSTSLMLLSTG